MQRRDGFTERFFARSWPLVLLITALVVVPLLVSGELSAADTRQRIRAAELRTTADLAARAAEIVASRVLETRDQIARLRGTPIQNNALRQALSNDDAPAAAEAVRLAHAAVGPDVLRLFVVGPDGRVLVADPRDAHRGEDLGSAEYVRDALGEIEARVRAVYAEGTGRDAIPVAAISAQFVFSARPGPPPIPGAPSLVFSRRVLVAELDLSRIGEGLRPLLVEAAEIYVIDSRGRLITRTRAGGGETLRDLQSAPFIAAALGGKIAAGETSDPLSGETRLAGSSIVPELGWVVLVTRHVDAISREVEDVLGQLFASRLLLAAVLLVGGFALARAIGRTVAQRRALAFANANLVLATEAKSRLLANMSHEIRTPLNAINGFSQLLLEGGAGPLVAKQAEYVEEVRSAGQHLLALVNEILDLSKAEAGKVEMRPEEVDLRGALEAVCELVRPLASVKTHSLSLRVEDGLGRIHHDPVRLRQIGLNLLSNAVKFTPPNGTISLTARRIGDEHFEIAVADSGPGIPPEELSSIFEEFHRLEGARSTEGTGLGLALVKRLAELMGGGVSVDSSLGEGSVFRVQLPLRQPEI